MPKQKSKRAMKKAAETHCVHELKIDLAVENWPVGKLKPNPRNVRTHSKRQCRALAHVINDIGFINPVIVDEDGMILAGHGRVEAAKLLGLAAVPAIRVAELTDAQKRAYVLADNKLAERAGWDQDALAAELGELSVLLPEVDLSLELTGFELGDVDRLLSDTEEHKAAAPDDEPAEVPQTPICKPGDLWTLGRHRLLCGDARDGGLVQQLLGDERVDLTFTDSPYNVPIDGHAVGNGQISHPDFAMASGEMSAEQFTAFLRSICEIIAQVSRDGALAFICMDWRHLRELQDAADGVFSEMKNLVVWSKTNGGMGSLYRSAHELIAVFKVGAGEHVNNVQLGKFGRNRTNVWTYAGVNAFKAGRNEELASHPTCKPVALVVDAIKDVSARGDVVLDLFGGSGTTLIAAERTGRRARLMEIEPRYCDVIIKRFEQITKADAIHQDSGATFTELAQVRD